MTASLIPILHREHAAARGLQFEVEQDARDRLRSKLLRKESGSLLVGIAWTGEQVGSGVQYSVNILEWGPILHVPDVTFVNLQPGDCRVELASASKGFKVPIVHKKTLDPQGNTKVYAMRVAAMDIVIGPDCAATAIASAFGIPALCLVPPNFVGVKPPESTRVIAQKQPGSWLEVIRDAGLALLDHAVRAGATTKRAPYLRSIGQAFAGMGQLADAEHVYRVMTQEPDLAAEGFFLIASLKYQQRQFEDALALFNNALAADSTFWQAYNGAGFTLAALHRFDEAIDSYRKGLDLNPKSGEIHNNLGTSLRSMGRAPEALPHYREARALLPNIASIRLNEASALDEMGDTDAALKAFDELIAREPDYVDAYYNKAQTLLSLGQFEEGWKKFVWRLKRANANARHDIFPHKIWSGEDLSGKNILVWTEQGIGDELLTFSMIPDLIRACKNVTLLCSERLIPLARRSFPEATVEHRAEPLPACATSPSIDFQMSLSELGQAFRQSFDDFPTDGCFLKADEEKTVQLRKHYQDIRPNTRLVGISWMSQKNFQIGWLKSQNLLSWAPILAAPNVTFVNLQYGDRAQDLKAVKETLGVEILHDESIDALADMDSFAAQVAAMDLVISVSNTTVHTAGALGRPTWVLTAKGRGRIWYWFRNQDKGYWYSSVRLLSQDTEGEWTPVLERCAADLADWSQKK